MDVRVTSLAKKNNPIDDAFEFIESVLPQPSVTVSEQHLKRKAREHFNKTGEYIPPSTLDIMIYNWVENQKMKGVLATHYSDLNTIMITAVNDFNEAIKTLNHEYLHSTLTHLENDRVSKSLDRKYGTVQEIQEYGV